MGGAKKRTLAQADKQQQIQGTKQQKTAKTSKTDAKNKTGDISPQEITGKDLNELAKIKALTPYAVATKYNIRLSAAKEVLEMLEKRKSIQYVAGNRGIKIYKFIGNT